MATTDTERQEILELLPWYLNNTLSEDEAERVKHYLDSSPELANEVNFTSTVLKQTGQEVPVPMLTHERLRGVMDRIDSAEPNRAQPRRLARWFSEWRTSLLTGPNWQAGAAVAAALVVAVLVVVPQLQPDPYEVLTNNSDDPSLILRVEFESGLGDEEIQDMLNVLSLDAERESTAVYSVSLPDEMSVGDVHLLLEKLRADDRVVTAILPKQD